MSDDDYETPSIERVRTKFATVLDDTAGWKFSAEWAGDFDRWLAAHDAALLGRVEAVLDRADAEARCVKNDDVHIETAIVRAALPEGSRGA